jgi:hypothetical protein
VHILFSFYRERLPAPVPQISPEEVQPVVLPESVSPGNTLPVDTSEQPIEGVIYKKIPTTTTTTTIYVPPTIPSPGISPSGL